MNFFNQKSSILQLLNRLSLLTIFVLSSYSLHAQKNVRIGYIDTEYILENINEYSIANTELDSKVVKWKSEIELRLKSLDDEKKKLNNERVLLTSELILEREEDLQIIETEILDYQQKRFGPGGDLIIQKKQLMQPIQDQIFTAVQEIANSKEYDIIFNKSDVIMLYSADRYDISDRVLKTINRSSKRTQAKNKKERKKVEKESTVVTIDSGKSERQKLLDKRKAERKALLEKKRQEKLKARQDRKKELKAKKEIEKKVSNKKEEKSSTKQKIDPNTAPSTEIENKKKERKALLEKKRQEKLKAREDRKKDLEAKKLRKTEKHITKENEKNSFEETKIKNDEESLNEKNLSSKDKRKKDLEARKKALKEKKMKLNKERKSRIEAQRKKRDSIKNNK